MFTETKARFEFFSAGASSGLGIETARVLALRGAEVVTGVRRVDAGEEAKQMILNSVPNAKVKKKLVPMMSGLVECREICMLTKYL